MVTGEGFSKGSPRRCSYSWQDDMSSATLEPSGKPKAESEPLELRAVESVPAFPFPLSAASTSDLPDASVLVDQVPAQFKAPRSLAGWTLVLGLIYLVFSLLPVWHTEIWGQLSYGRLV